MLKKSLFVLCLCAGILLSDVCLTKANANVRIVDFLLPVASGADTFKNEAVVLDYSNSSQGYFMGKTTSSKHDTLKLIVSLGRASQNYEISDTLYQTYPLNFGDGTYTIQICEHIQGESYKILDTVYLDVALESPELPYLYPNQVVDYNKNTLCVAKSFELVQNAFNDLERVQAINTWVDKHISYDFKKAKDVKGKYVLPILDDTFKSKKGICFDQASLLCAMLRVQEIPAKVVTGTSTENYHAWCEVYINGVWIKPFLLFDENGKKVSNLEYSKLNKAFNEKYTVKYTY